MGVDFARFRSIVRESPSMKASESESISPRGRVIALDFFRGVTMFLLIAEFTSFFNQLTDPSLKGTWIHAIGAQFHHHPWDGLRFWDLIQPFFMFIVGVAIPFSETSRRLRGESESEIFRHALKRSGLLLALGWGLYCMGPGHIVFRFQNVLAQLSVTYLIAFWIRNRSFSTQVGVSMGMILISQVLYCVFWVEGFNHPFAKLENFGTWLDLQYGGADLGGGWVSFNAIPTTAHTIWGVLAGKLLLGPWTERDKLGRLVLAGISLLALGYALSAGIPIIKRICTASFVLVSGGWSLIALGGCYGLIDLKNWSWGIRPMAIVGMNPLFIYLFAHIGGADMLRDVVKPFTTTALSWIGDLFASAVTSLGALYLLWFLCYWLYRRSIFIRI